jgi:hypothetical protein
MDLYDIACSCKYYHFSTYDMKHLPRCFAKMARTTLSRESLSAFALVVCRMRPSVFEGLMWKRDGAYEQ